MKSLSRGELQDEVPIFAWVAVSPLGDLAGRRGRGAGVRLFGCRARSRRQGGHGSVRAGGRGGRKAAAFRARLLGPGHAAGAEGDPPDRRPAAGLAGDRGPHPGEDAGGHGGPATTFAGGAAEAPAGDPAAGPQGRGTRTRRWPTCSLPSSCSPTRRLPFGCVPAALEDARLLGKLDLTDSQRAKLGQIPRHLKRAPAPRPVRGRRQGSGHLDAGAAAKAQGPVRRARLVTGGLSPSVDPRVVKAAAQCSSMK